MLLVANWGILAEHIVVLWAVY